MGVQSVSLASLSLETNLIREQPIFWRVIQAVERIAASVLLIIALPGLLVTALVIIILSGRSPVIAHRRVGYKGRDIWVLKLRTMWPCNPEPVRGSRFVERIETDSIPHIKSRIDPRVTSRFALFCRKYSIDELPQLWQVVTGEMALVGPRPVTATEIEAHYGSSAGQLLSVKPGITGLWQVKGRSRLRRLQRKRLDLFMIRRWSAALYLLILLATLPRVLTGKDAW